MTDWRERSVPAGPCLNQPQIKTINITNIGEKE